MAACFRETAYVERHLVSVTNTTQYAWFTGWMLATGVDTIRAVMKVKNATGTSFQAQPAIQTAAVRTDAPGAASALGSLQTGNTEYNTQNVTVSTVTSGALWFRLGVAYQSSTAGLTQADVGLGASFQQFGGLLDSRTVELTANDTSLQVAVLTRWFPAVFFSKIKAVFAATGALGGTAFQFQLAIQSAPTSIEQPGTWSLLGSAQAVGSSSVEVNLGELAPASAVTDMWLRVGVVYNLSSGTTRASSTLSATVTARN